MLGSAWKKRGLDSERARAVRKQGHDDALEFALTIGLNSDYRNDLKAKKMGVLLVDCINAFPDSFVRITKKIKLSIKKSYGYL
ncbi:MAG: hypothetical protein LBN01_02940 [Endomicrobium sp.]|nr:hypothetical protein [Endomicrobium sp.]